MNKISYFIIFFLILNNCSFDNKTGIWTGSDKIVKKKKKQSKNLELIFKKQNKLIEEKNYHLIKNKIDNLKTYW